jgi:hypothetical protein
MPRRIAQAAPEALGVGGWIFFPAHVTASFPTMSIISACSLWLVCYPWNERTHENQSTKLKFKEFRPNFFFSFKFHA